MQIRTARRDDADAVRGVHLSAFPETESEVISKLAVELLAEETAPPILSLVAEVDGTAVGHVAFSPVTIHDTGDFLGYILAPLAVRFDHQKCGIGTGLIECGIERLSQTGAGVLLVYGDPKYYGKFGFSAAAAECYTPPYPLQYSFGWQGMPLGDCPVRVTKVLLACVSSLTNPELW